MNIKNKHVIILGAGRSGRAAAALALREGADVSVHDTASDISGLDGAIRTVSCADLETGKASRCEVLVLSPGIDGESDFVRAYAENAKEFIGEVEFASRFYHGRVIAITGTNGKTTTTELVQRLLSFSGISCRACGNYGVPFSEVVMMGEVPDSVALEVSSFQLETIHSFHPEVVIWLNFSADHMDRYPSIDAYKNAKLRIFENLEPKDLVVVRAGENIGVQNGRLVTFSTEQEADYQLKGTTITRNDRAITDLKNSQLRGLHNAENAMAAIAATVPFTVSAEAVSKALQKFSPPRHRCELVRVLDGVEYINDSKATNLHALDSALRSQGRPMVLIAGGKQKGLNFNELCSRIEQTTKAVLVFGEIRDELLESFAPLSGKIHLQKVSTLDEAVTTARTMAADGDTVLFSPGTSSFDMFSSYEHRGDSFCDIVNGMK